MMQDHFFVNERGDRVAVMDMPLPDIMACLRDGVTTATGQRAEAVMLRLSIEVTRRQLGL